MYEKSVREHESGGTARYTVCYTQPHHGRNDSPFYFVTISYNVPVLLCTLAHIETERGTARREGGREREIAKNGLIRVEHSARTMQIALL